jgi:RNA polymerase sigma factor (sigma-70 family)
MPSNSESGSRLREGFLQEREEAITAVRAWVAAVVHGRWRFRDPESVIQEILVELLRMGRDGRVRPDSSFRSFVMTVACHTCVDLWRRERLRTSAEVVDDFFDDIVDPGGDPEEAARQRQRLEQVRFVFQALDEPCRELLGRVFGDGMSSAKAGAHLGITAGNVRVRVHRCLQAAREIRRTYFPDGPQPTGDGAP